MMRELRLLGRNFLVITLLTLIISLYLWKIEIRAQPTENFVVNNISVSGDFTRFAFSGRFELSANGVEPLDHIDVYDIATLQLLYSIPVDSSPVLLVSLNHNGTKLAYSTRLGNVIIYDIITSVKNEPVSGGFGSIDKLFWSPTEDKLASVMRAQISIELNGVRYRGMIDTAGIGRISSLDWSGDGRILASTDYSSQTVQAVLQFWDLSTGTSDFSILNTPNLRIPDAGGSSISWDVTNQMVVAKEADGLHIYQVATGNKIAYLNQNNPIINGSGPIEWIPGTTRIVGGDNNGIYQWDYISGSISRLFTTSPITQLVWTPSGLLHNGGGRGLYINDQALADIVLTPTPTVTDTPTNTP